LQGSELVSVQAQNTVIAPIEIMKHGWKATKTNS
jgi:hypothetical protein